MLLRAPRQQDPHNTARLRRELELANVLRSEWALRPLAVVREGDRTMLMLEDPGGDLVNLARLTPMSVERFLRVGIKISGAVAEIHRSGLVHKDLKPDHIILDQSDRVRITGFGFATDMPTERQSSLAVDTLAGTLAYIAPEQTGYVDQRVDTRSDLYSLGVIFFELLTGRLPFCAADASEWIHCHIAREPPRLRERLPGIAQALEGIIAQLLAKAPEDRYQTAAAVQADLTWCLASWRTHGRIEPFALAAGDAPTRLSMPDRVYGRDEEMHGLRSAVDRLLDRGDPAFFLISGGSGVGKSSLVNELGKYLRGKPALFACGKFDQFRSNEPYAAAAQAFQALVRRILSTPAEEVARWRAALADALGGSGQLIANLVPELELLLGKQPTPPELAAQDAQNHFQSLFARFLAVFATREHPLILFFDDLQWLDVATLDFIERLASEQVAGDLLVIGAYRDNEVGPHHPLTAVLSKIRAAEVAMEEIRLRPLPRAEVDRMVSEALLSERSAVAKVGELVHRKTGGNPFFIRQFLSTLEDRGLMRFDRAQAIWSCDVERARAMRFTDNVVDMMIEKLRRLPAATQAALGTLACLGSTADIRALELIQEEPGADMHAILAAAVRNGYVTRTDTSYTFVHDRIHEAAHELIALPGRVSTHLRIARLLAGSAGAEVRDERLFDVVSHFNRGADLLADTEERQRVVRLNLCAARRSKAASAAKAAIEYLDVAVRLLGDDPWARCYDLAFEVHFERAECHYLLGAAEEAELRLIDLGQRAQGATRAALVASVRINLYTTLARMREAVAVGLEYLQSVAIPLPPRPTAGEVAAAYSSLLGRAGDGYARSLAELPRMTDPQWSAVLDVLATMCSPALFTDPHLLQLIVAQMVAISLAHGNAHASALAYVWVGSIFGSVLQEYGTGAEFARSGMRLLEVPGLDRFKARATLVYAVLVLPWTQPLSECRRMNERSLEYAMEVGDLSFASYARNHRVQKMFGAGEPLGEVEREAIASLQFAQRIRSGLTTPLLAGTLHVTSMLRGSQTPEIATRVARDLKSLESHFDANPPLAIAACWYWIAKLTACVHLGDLEGSLQAAARARALLWTSTGEFVSAEYHFHAALAYAAAWDDAGPTQRRSIHAGFEEAAAPLSRWSATCPETFSGRAALVAAEQARIEGNEIAAMRHYDEAITRSQEYGFVQIEALANARAAHFYERRGFNFIAEAYWGRCRRCYQVWDAHARVIDLERLHPQALAHKESAGDRSSVHLPVSQLDSFAIVRASQALSSEIVLPRLIETLVKQTIEHAGAERCALVLLRNGAPHVAAVGRASQAGIEVTLRDQPVSSSDLPEAGLRYVLRTGKRLIIDSVATSDLLSGDPYAHSHAPRSVLYTPIIKQANLIGALYLENGRAKNAFTPDRIIVLEFLASQAAISLDNAYLYSDLGRSEAFLAEGQRISHTGSWSWCTATDRVHWSDEHYRLLRIDPSEAPTPTVELFLSRVHPADRDGVRDLIHAHVGRASSFAVDFRVLLPDGTVRHLHGEGRPKPGGSGDAVEYIGTTVDVTDRKLVEDALRDAQADLMRAARLASVGELTASIAHEINQPLAAIIANGTTCINWLAHEPPRIDPARAAAERVIANATRAAEIIQSIRGMAQKTDSRMTRLDLNDAIGEIMMLLSSELHRRSVTIETRYGENLPPILGSRIQIQQVVVNLIINAADAMEGIQDRRRAIRVTTRSEEPGMAVTEVTDTGSGMDSATLGRVFEPLYTTKPQGLGIGLSICRSIVAAHNGHISACSVPGEGSSFTFALPVLS